MADTRLPLYRHITDRLSHQIRSGLWAAGAAIPSEIALASEHEVSIGTVRRAIDCLVADGVLERQQGRGTFVRRPKFKSSLFRFFRFCSQSGERLLPESKVISLETCFAPTAVQAVLELSSSCEVIRLLRVRAVSSQPVLVEEIWLPCELFSLILKVDLEQQGPLLYPLYERICGQTISGAKETLTAEAVGEREARILNVPANSPVIVIDRLARNYSGRPVEWRRSRGQATDFCYSVEIR